MTFDMEKFLEVLNKADEGLKVISRELQSMFLELEQFKRYGPNSYLDEDLDYFLDKWSNVFFGKTYYELYESIKEK